MTVTRGIDFEIRVTGYVHEAGNTYSLQLSCIDDDVEIEMTDICKGAPTFSVNLDCEQTPSGYQTAQIIANDGSSETVIYQSNWYIQ
jgi:hypothetical protein